MKVLFVVKNLRVSNGVASFLMNYYRELIKKENMSFDFLIVSNTISPYYDEIEKNNGKIFIMPSLRHPLKMINYLKNIFHNNSYDILHSNVINSNVLIAYFAKKYRIPVRILHCHATANGDSVLKILRNKPFQYLSIKYSNYYFACSHLAGKQIFKNKVFYVINNAIDLERFKFSNAIRNEIRLKNGITNDTIIVGVVARITFQKNPYFILRIVESLKQKNANFNLWWFGSGNLDKCVFNKAEELGLTNYIEFWGSIDDVSNYYSALDCFILPSFYEGLPVVGIEAQANGLKCLFSDRITREVDILDSNFFLSINNINSWVNAILKVKANYNRKIDYNIFNCYLIESQADKIFLLYKSLLNNQKGK